MVYTKLSISVDLESVVRCDFSHLFIALCLSFTDVYIQDSGCTPLSIACKHEAVKSAELLLEHNANPNGSANVSSRHMYNICGRM